MKISPYLQLVRPVNLFMLALTQYFVDIFILQPNFAKYGILFSLNEFQFFLLVFSTVLICAGGYVINDYFDQQIDSVNKPSKQIIGKSIPAQTAVTFYLIISFAGVALGAYLAIALHYWKLVTIQIVAMAILYFYSASFKRTPLLGNILVSLLAALSVVIVMVFEPHLYRLARPGDYFIAGLCNRFILGISVFAFTLTMLREIVKDMEDVIGDRQYNARTIPVAWGMMTAKIISLLFILISLGAFGYLYQVILDKSNIIYLVYIAILGIFLIFTGVRIIIAQHALHFHKISMMVKLAMLFGILLMPLYFILQF